MTDREVSSTNPKGNKIPWGSFMVYAKENGYHRVSNPISSGKMNNLPGSPRGPGGVPTAEISHEVQDDQPSPL